MTPTGSSSKSEARNDDPDRELEQKRTYTFALHSCASHANARHARHAPPPVPPSYPPFSVEGDDQQALFQMIRSGAFRMDPHDWSSISEPAKDLVRKMLVVDPVKRLTAAQVMSHPWLRADAASIPDAHLGNAAARLKKFVARRRLKKAMQAIRAIVRIKLVVAGIAVRKAREAGADEQAQETAFFEAAQNKGGPSREEPLDAAYAGEGRQKRVAASRRAEKEYARRPAEPTTGAGMQVRGMR